MGEEAAGRLRAARVQTLRLEEKPEPRPLQPQHDGREGNHVSFCLPAEQKTQGQDCQSLCTKSELETATAASLRNKISGAKCDRIIFLKRGKLFRAPHFL